MLLVFVAALLPIMGALVAVFLLWLVHLWNAPLWILGLVGLAVVAVAAFVLWRTMRFFARHRFQFSIRAMLIAIAAFALVLGTLGHGLRGVWRQQRAVWHVAEHGGYVRYLSDKTDRNWLQTRFGHDPFGDVEEMTVRGDGAIPALLQHRKEFADLTNLLFSGGITDAGLERVGDLNRFPELRVVNLLGTKITDAGLEHLGNWTNLRVLWLNGCSMITDDGLAHLENLRRLETLSLIVEGNGKMPITDAGLAHLGRMSQLNTLYLVGLPITDAGLAHLQSLTNLERFCIRRTKVTESGLEELYNALPDCWIVSDDAWFPSVMQIRRISVWEELPQEERIATISEPDRIAKIKECLEQYRAQHQGGWSNVWDSASEPRLRVDFEGRSRCLCQIRLGDGFFQFGWGWTYRPMSDSEAKQLLDLLGLDTAGLVSNSASRSSSEQPQTPAVPDQLR